MCVNENDVLVLMMNKTKRDLAVKVLEQDEIIENLSQSMIRQSYSR